MLVQAVKAVAARSRGLQSPKIRFNILLLLSKKVSIVTAPWITVDSTVNSNNFYFICGAQVT